MGRFKGEPSETTHFGRHSRLNTKWLAVLSPAYLKKLCGGGATRKRKAFPYTLSLRVQGKHCINKRPLRVPQFLVGLSYFEAKRKPLDHQILVFHVSHSLQAPSDST